MVVRMSHLVTVSMSILIATSCAKGTVKLEDQDKFGKVKSAVWFEWTQEVEGADRTTHSFLAANQSRVCASMQEAIPEVAQAYEDATQQMYGVTETAGAPYDTGGYGGYSGDICVLYKEYLNRVGEALDPIMDGGVNLLSFNLRDPDDDAEDEPPSDEYEAGYGGEDDPYFTGSLSYYEANPYRVAADEIDCGGDDWYNEFYDAFDDVDIFTFDDGDLTAEQTGNGEAYKIEMDGDLHEDDGDDGGDIVFKGKFTKCEVEYEGAIYLYGFGGVGSSYYSSYSSSYSSYSDYSYR